MFNAEKKPKKTVVPTLVLILLLTSSAFAVMMPTSTAHDPPWTIKTYAYMSASPNPIGVNQPALLVMWVNDYPITANGQYGDRWQNMEVTVTKPDGTTETLGPFTSDPVGAAYTTYTPNQVGEYTFVFSWPGKLITGEPIPPPEIGERNPEYIGDTYLGATSDPVTLTVQEEQIQPYEETPIPDGYWERPISALNRAWGSIAGHWLQGADNPGDFNRYSLGPESSHIMWTLPYWEGGIMGGQLGDLSYYTGQSYETFGNGLIILNGKLYYNVRAPPRMGWWCVDLRTGEQLYFHNTTGAVTYDYPPYGFDYSGRLPEGELLYGQVLNYDSPNQHGGFPYLWGTAGPYTNELMLFDGFTGNYICRIANVSTAGTMATGKDGSLLWYNIVRSDGDTRLTIWNTTQAIWYEDEFESNYYWMWRPDLNATYDGNDGYSLDVSIPDVAGSIYKIIPDEIMIGGVSGNNDDNGVTQGHIWAISLAPGHVGSLLWNVSFTPPKNSLTYGGGLFGYGKVSGPTVSYEDGIFVFKESIRRVYWGYDLETGQQLWETESKPAWDFYGMSESIAYGKLLSYGYAGFLTCYDMQTGTKLWDYTSGTTGFETFYENDPLQLGAIADGKIYLFTSEHSPTMPLSRGKYMRCIDIDSGTELWKIEHWGTDPAIADGYLVDLNLYDNQYYCYGKGPSETTVTTSPKVVANGGAVLIEGTVTDQCEGAMGTPAIADEYMNDWMEYIYQQRPIPADAKGVSVVLTAMSDDGSSYSIGTVQSDMSGMFSAMWQPPAEGKYTIVATFEGSASYAASYAETAVGVCSAAVAEVSPEVTPGTAADLPMEILAAVAVLIIAAIAIVIVVVRKKK
ncbi:MAG: PQQ-like beta-propeller repeat protein [Candidatus Bathyarchaeota archaeon]|nr:PQQ-like beta-propeller repeat protein [Candidatus Bathyarchaeota archaeon]